MWAKLVKHIRIVYIVTGIIFIIVVLTFVLMQRYLRIVDHPLDELEYASLYYYDEVRGEYIDKMIEDKNELKVIYDDLNAAKVSAIRLCGRDECGSDSGWMLTMQYKDGIESYDYDKEIKNIKYGCRKYIKNVANGTVDGMVIISAEKLVEDINSGYFEKNTISD